jgi:glycosyltransferase involved in cell wall biosynthesis
MVIGIVVFHGNASLSFSIMNIIDILCERGHEVHFFQNRKRDWEEVSDHELDSLVRIHLFDTRSQTYEHSRKNFIDILKLAHFIRLHVPRYDVIIGVDQDAVIASFFVKLLGKARKLVYLSTEIILKEDYAHKGRYFLIKHWLEKRSLRSAEQLWIQDQFRGKVLVEDLGCPDYPLTILPHSPRSSGHARKKSLYLREKYHLADALKILIYTGGIDPVYHSLQLAEMAARSDAWPEDAVLIMHGFGNDRHLEYLKSLQNQRFILSTELVSFAKLEELIASADLGLAVFNPEIDTNHRFMTSGKIMSYLKAGIPVIVTGTPTTRDVVERHHTGVCIEKLSDLPTAYLRIVENYRFYAECAAQAFTTEYEFDKNFHKAWNRLIS